ncbi:predicted protein [Naegleria gruberi]|uniref:Predicted protein n=1 Tax=Naegleria gruberi TaxID=5762 RepID=D2V5B0_NAEGR|nr:uncharacterized protein NAEGRDRAFT_64076 [Naegleria gruberi]EFC48243.1 predicted protein [Naegleria gruberi]|eukprot:XP_002680987.1 predicted protein [Naegleria gruberi strain NEG-M]
MARDPTSLYMTLCAGFVFVVGLTLRIIIGRKIFPCGIITFSFFTLPPAVMLPTVFRMLRIYLMYKINLLKMKLFDVSAKDSTVGATSVTNPNGIVPINQLKEQTEVELKKSDSKIFGLEDMAGRQEQIHKVVNNFDPNNYEDIGLDPPNWDDSTTDGDSESQADVSTWNMSEFKEVSDVKKQVKQLAILNFFISKKFILSTYAIAFLVGVIIWVVLGIVEEVTYNASTDPNKKRLFLFDGGLFVFERGCGLTTTTVLIVGVHALVYIFLELVFLILAVMADRDTWGIKRETLLLIIVQVGAAIIFIVVGMLDITEKLLDYLVPTGLALWIYELIEIIMCVGMPAMYAFISDRKSKLSQSNNDTERKQAVKETGIEKVLKNKKTYQILLDFARRSYCTESVLCWRDIQRFKKARKANRKKAATHILKAYLTAGAPLELNISKIEERRSEIEKLIEENPNISHNLFALIQDHCLNDMTDLFERLKSSNKQIGDIVKELKSLNNSVQSTNSTQ